MNLHNFIPRTLKGRFFLGSTISLFALQIIIIIVFVWDINDTWTDNNLKFSLVKLTSIARIIDATPDNIQRESAKSQSSHGLVVYISDLPIETTVRNNSFEQKLSDAVGISEGSVRIMTDDTPELNIDEFPIPKEEDFIDNFENKKRPWYMRILGYFGIYTAPEAFELSKNDTHNNKFATSMDKKKMHRSRVLRNTPTMSIEDFYKKAKISERFMEKNSLSMHGSIKLSNNKYLVFAKFRPHHFLPKISSRVFYAIVFTSILGAFILYLLVQELTMPLAKLTSQVNILSRDYESKPLPIQGPDEIQDLLRSFNRMQERITTFIQDRTRILASISHDLKTPLTSLMLRAELMPDSEDKTKLLSTINNMTKMVRATLDFARSEENGEKSRELHLPSLIDSIVNDYQDNNKEVSFEELSEYNKVKHFLCKPTEMHRILQNLIDNGLCYGSKVSVSLEESPDEVIITITDNGPGIPEDKQESVFKPFMRLDEVRPTDNAHVGLGLSIVRNLVYKQGGVISLANITPHGLSVKITYKI